jgi:hypothetical protein
VIWHLVETITVVMVELAMGVMVAPLRRLVPVAMGMKFKV